MVERHRLELQRRRRSAVSVAHGDRALERRRRRRGAAPAPWPAASAAASRSAATVGRARRSACRRSGSRRRRAARSARSGRTGRARRAAPKSGEHDDQIAPRLAAARKATRVSTELGASATTRSPATDTGRGQARAGPGDEVAQLAVGDLALGPVLPRPRSPRCRRRPGRAGGQGVLGVVQRRAGEPLRCRASRGGPASRSAGRGSARRGSSATRRPEAVEVADRPGVQARVVEVVDGEVGADVAVLPHPPREARDAGITRLVRIGGPQDGGALLGIVGGDSIHPAIPLHRLPARRDPGPLRRLSARPPPGGGTVSQGHHQPKSSEAVAGQRPQP